MPPPISVLRTPAATVLHGRSAGYEGGTARGSLSLKTMRGGRALYQVERAAFRVDDERFLVLNDAQPYRVEVDEAVESFCLFFHAEFAAEVLRALRASPDALLDEPRREGARVPELLVRTFPTAHPLGGLLAAARDASERGGLGATALEARSIEMLEALWRLAGEVRAEQGRLPWSRAATRAEVDRRVTRAREYAEAYLARPLTVRDLADVAHLAPHHFLRAFRAVTGETPHAYLARRRVERAHALLRLGRSVGDAAADVGFESPTSFAAAYRRRFGRAPSQDRAPRSS